MKKEKKSEELKETLPEKTLLHEKVIKEALTEPCPAKVLTAIRTSLGFEPTPKLTEDITKIIKTYLMLLKEEIFGK